MVEVEGRWQQAKQTRDELRAQLQQINGQIREIQTVRSRILLAAHCIAANGCLYRAPLEQDPTIAKRSQAA